MKKSILTVILGVGILGNLLLAEQKNELTKTQISMLYVSLFNRASEGEGNRYWRDSKLSLDKIVNEMLKTPDAKEYFGNSLDTNQAFMEHIYKNTLNKTPTDDPNGIEYWVKELNSGTPRGQVLVSFVNAAIDPVNAGVAQNQFNNRVAISNYLTNTIDTVPDNYKKVTGFAYDLKVTDDETTVENSKSKINSLADNSFLDDSFVRNRITSNTIYKIWNIPLKVSNFNENETFDIGINIVKEVSGAIGNILIKGISIKDNQINHINSITVFGKKSSGLSSSIIYKEDNNITKYALSLNNNRLLIKLGHIIKNQDLVSETSFKQKSYYDIHIFLTKIGIKGSTTINEDKEFQTDYFDFYTFPKNTENINGLIIIE